MSGFEAVVPLFSAIGSVASAVGAFGGGGRDAPPPPVVEKPKIMPTPDDDAVKRKRRKSIAEQLTRSGRASTILSDPGELLGA